MNNYLLSIQKNGFTLLEFIMMIIIISIIVGMSGSLFFQGFNSFLTSNNLTDANWQGQIAIERMSRDIRAALSSNDITKATASTFAFTDISGNTISYSLSGSNLNITLNGSTETLANGVNSLTFAYYNISGAVTAVLTSIAYIQITLNITKNNTNYTTNTALFPRNFY